MKIPFLTVVSLLFIAILWLPACDQIAVKRGEGGQDTTASQSVQNYAFIRQQDTPDEIIRKAAMVVPTPRQLAWQQNEFIAFTHFGINTFTDREWGEGNEDPSLFNPSDFDPLQWVNVIREAGMKMLIITAKHHDGFCLWPSQYTDHSVRNSPWKDGQGDIVADLASACHEAGIRFGIYLSPWDRHEACYGDSPAYNEFFRNQLRELLTNYGEISEVWFDGACGEGPNGKRQVYDWPSYYRVVRELQPNAVIFGMGPDVRWVGTESGVGRETEWSVLPDVIRPADSMPLNEAFSVDALFITSDRMANDLGSRERILSARSLYWYPAEADVSIRPGWFCHDSQDSLVKTPQQLVDIYFSSVGRNAVLLLNIPPNKRGLIGNADCASLKGMRSILDQIFDTNLLVGAAIHCSGERHDHGPAFLTDGDPLTCWSGDSVASSIEITLPAPESFDVLLLQENIRSGQRIEQFSLEVLQDGQWVKVCTGTTVGYKRLLRFAPVTAERMRLVISESRVNPELVEMGVYSSR